SACSTWSSSFWVDDGCGPALRVQLSPNARSGMAISRVGERSSLEARVLPRRRRGVPAARTTAGDRPGAGRSLAPAHRRWRSFMVRGLVAMHNTCMPADAPAAAPAARSLPPRTVRSVLFALATGGFAIGTSEFAVMGLMPEIARGLDVSEPQVGHVISAYALGVVVGAPLLAILGARLPRRTLLLGLMGFYALGNLASALSPGYHAMLLFRFIAGLPHGAYFGVAALVAASISPPGQRGRAVGLVMLGLSIALLVGNPLATWLGQLLEWRYAFCLVSVIALLTVAMAARSLPPDADEPHQDPIRELRDFNRKPVWLALGIGAIGFSGMFCVFSYLAPTMTQVTGLPESWIPSGLVAFGVGSIVGTLGGGWLYDRLGFRAAALVLAWSVLVLLVFPLAAQAAWSLLLVVVAVGTMGALA